MVPAFLTFLSAAAQSQKLNFEAPLQILDNNQGNASPRYASDVSITMMPTFIKNGKGLVGCWRLAMVSHGTIICSPVRVLAFPILSSRRKSSSRFSWKVDIHCQSAADSCRSFP